VLFRSRGEPHGVAARALGRVERGADVGALMHAADAALYAAKRAGRNTVRIAASPATAVARPEAPVRRDPPPG